MDYSRNIHYFTYRKKTPTLSIVLFILGFIMPQVGIPIATLASIDYRLLRSALRVYTLSDTEMIAIGVVLSLLGVGALIAGVAYNSYVKKRVIIVKDNEIDSFCDRMVNYVKTQALHRLGLDEDNLREAEPIMVKGYNFSGKMGMQSHIKRGRDQILRSSDYQVTLFYFSKDQVHSYVRVFSVISDTFFESTDEYFYRDIVSVSTTQEQTRIGIVDCFKLTTSGGTSVTATFSRFDADNVHRSISAMRNLLKSKKQTMG